MRPSLLTGQQSWYQSRSTVADMTVPMCSDAPLQDTHTHIGSGCLHTDSQSAQDTSTQSAHTNSSAQDASTQLSWTALPRRRICSKKRSRTPDPRRDTHDSYAGPLSRPTLVNVDRWDAPPHLCSSRLAGRPGLLPSPTRDVLPSELIPSKAKPPRASQAHDTSTANAATSTVSPPSGPLVQQTSTAHAGNAYCSIACRSPAAS